jgi:hypothetical protein
MNEPHTWNSKAEKSSDFGKVEMGLFYYLASL